jgi:hypothetical protein
MIKRLGFAILGLIVLIALQILHTLRIIKVDDEYGF